jgi:diacylglycerol kinase
MSRVVNVNSTGKNRNRLMRTAAELLRHLSQKAELDNEAKDMAAHLVFCLRGVDDGIESSAMAWEKRDYWLKADQLRQRWSWAGNAAASLEAMIRNETWESLPGIMASLFSHFADIKITKFTRDSSEWHGACQRLADELG